jgi:GalNAc-alpha-(1->4)-GalNAc-alpha-(1->3)-diNAcBac-PP-undecaprenol alpha-1,4-N-acetyl-D-galactosaminyltransferase
MRLTLIIHDLSSGGAERVLSNMANYWAKKGWDITLLLLYATESIPMHYDLHPAIKVVYCKAMIGGDPSLNFLQRKYLERLIILRKAILKSDPQLIISFLKIVNVVVLLASWGLKIPIIISERNYPLYFNIRNLFKPPRWFLYPQASCLVGVTQPIVSKFSKSVQKRAKVIPNPVLIPTYNNKIYSKGSSLATRKTVMAMGRLKEQKGFDLLLKAFSHIVKKHPDWVLIIWGEGPLRHYLENLRDELGLLNNVQFPGLTKQVNDEMRKADLFILSSRHEGFPNVLSKAMACGLPVISFDCPTGPSVIIRDGIDGILVPPGNVEILADTMDRLMGNPSERERLSSRAPEVTERFGLEKVMNMWEKLILDLIKK